MQRSNLTMNGTTRIILGLLAASAATAAGAAETLRCGGSLVDPGMVMAEVEAKCGPPDEREVEQVPIRGRTAAGGSIVIGQTTVERWTYERGLRFPALLTFEDDRLERIEYLTRR